ncbi:hypothetical protein [Acinetobacter indicus]|uniref:Uncharacterized protein n=1 Tax=Acinetobacter indicus TaxID=756892 RepID=A0A6C0Y0V6_9GAMM|nr:hypothetical protein [Acinetobacter indicus]QIC69816.1 hypothetical protein FSC09_05080 [Acinetobacter indicus]
MILDRKLQLELLEKMSSTYPNLYDFNKEYKHGTSEYDTAVANLYYLMQHNLVQPCSVEVSSAIGAKGIKSFQFGEPTINQNGIDFLADDGGLSAILGVVTIKIDPEQYRQILITRVQESNLPIEQKHQAVAVLQSLSYENIKHLSTKFVDLGWDNLGSLMHLIQNIPT